MHSFIPIFSFSSFSSSSSPLLSQVTLEQVLGLTCLSHNSLSSCAVTGAIAYPAGCVCVYVCAGGVD